MKIFKVILATGKDIEVKAEEVKIESDNLIFISNLEKSHSKCIIPKGWLMIEVVSDDFFQLNVSAPVEPVAVIPAVEAVDVEKVVEEIEESVTV